MVEVRSSVRDEELIRVIGTSDPLHHYILDNLRQMSGLYSIAIDEVQERGYTSATEESYSVFIECLDKCALEYGYSKFRDYREKIYAYVCGVINGVMSESEARYFCYSAGTYAISEIVDYAMIPLVLKVRSVGFTSMYCFELAMRGFNVIYELVKLFERDKIAWFKYAKNILTMKYSEEYVRKLPSFSW